MSNKKTKVTALVKAGTTPQVRDAVDLLRDELKNLKSITESNYKTTGQCENINIQSVTKVEDLIKAWSMVSAKSKAYDEAMLDLNINSAPEFTISGYNKAAWKEDINLRIAIITHQARKDELEALLKEAESFMTKEDLYAAFCAKLANFKK